MDAPRVVGSRLITSFQRTCMKTISLIATISLALAAASLAQAPSDTSPEKAAVIANDRTYDSCSTQRPTRRRWRDFFAEDCRLQRRDEQAAASAGAKPSKGPFAPGFRGQSRLESSRTPGLRPRAFAGDRDGKGFHDRHCEKRGRRAATFTPRST